MNENGNQYVLWHNNKYRKYRAMAYRSYWHCITPKCDGVAIWNDLKGGSIKLSKEHSTTLSIASMNILLEDDIIYNTVDIQPAASDSSSLLTSNRKSTDSMNLITTQLEQSTSFEPVTMPTSAAGIEGPAFVTSKYGTRQLVLKQHTFNRHVNREDVTYWRCSQFAVLRCRARVKTKGGILTVLNGQHNHEVILKARKYGSLKLSKQQATSMITIEPAGDAEDLVDEEPE